MSLIEEAGEPCIRMAYLAIVGSYSVNGVAALHTELLENGLFRDFSEMWPQRFNNKTNGVTPRRWLACCNPGLARLINEALGEDWISDLGQLADLRQHAPDGGFQDSWASVKRTNKERLATLVRKDCGVEFDPAALFDVQVKRIHEYKRQLLNVLHLIHLYRRIKDGDTAGWTPRCALIGGKAAPGYRTAKTIIKLVNNVATVINRDSGVGDFLKVAFLPDYRVSAMEVICPGTELSEQISTAGKEASGTGNMKFMMNGALTIGTLDGANIEIREEVGEDHFFLFGLTEPEIRATRGRYDPNRIIAEDADLSAAMRLLECGHFNQFEDGLFDGLIAGIRNPGDPWFTAADFRSYVEAQERAAHLYQQPGEWWCKSILNAAASGKFSSDRTIADYNRDIWRLEPVSSR
jgi:starch phosphorylase